MTDLRYSALSAVRSALSKAACAGMAALLTCALTFSPAFAEVKKSDIIAGESVESRNLTVNLCPSIDAKYALLMDSEGNVYFERSAYSQSQIASLTKIMTALVALEYNPDLSSTVTVTTAAAQIGESSAGLQVNDTMDLKTALKALLVASGNDSAQAIATSLGAEMLRSEGGNADDESACVARFVQAMNEKAQALSLTNTKFANPHGLDYDEFSAEMYSCAADVANEVKYAMQIGEFRDIVKQDGCTITVKRDGADAAIELESTDELIAAYEGTNGVKTGFTELAGACYAGSNTRGDIELYAIVLGSTSLAQRFDDAQTLWDWMYTHRHPYKLIDSSEKVNATFRGTTRDFPVVAEVSHSDWPDKTVKASVADPDMSIEVFDLDGNISQSVEYKTLTGNVRIGDIVGTITFKQHNEVVATADLIAVENVDGPSFFEGIGIWWSRVLDTCSGASQSAESVLLNKLPLILDKSDTSSSV